MAPYGVVLYSCAGHLVPYIAVVKDPNPVASLYGFILSPGIIDKIGTLGQSRVTLSYNNTPSLEGILQTDLLWK